MDTQSHIHEKKTHWKNEMLRNVTKLYRREREMEI